MLVVDMIVFTSSQSEQKAVSVLVIDRNECYIFPTLCCFQFLKLVFTFSHATIMGCQEPINTILFHCVLLSDIVSNKHLSQMYNKPEICVIYIYI